MRLEGPGEASWPRALTRLAVVVTTVVAGDGITKVLAASLASAGYGREILQPLQNPEFSLGLASASFPVTLVLAVLGIAALGGYAVWQAWSGAAPSWIPGLLIGGSIANLLDRAAFGAVHDWLRIGRVVINLADLAVALGLVGYVIFMALPLATGRNRA